jgi:hypothetical protein
MNRETTSALARSLVEHLAWYREAALYVADGDPAFGDWLATQRLRREISEHPEFLALFEAWGVRAGAFRRPDPGGRSPRVYPRSRSRQPPPDSSGQSQERR